MALFTYQKHQLNASFFFKFSNKVLHFLFLLNYKFLFFIILFKCKIHSFLL